MKNAFDPNLVNRFMTYYYFEVETNDADYVDKVTGEIIKGFRRYSSSVNGR